MPPTLALLIQPLIQLRQTVAGYDGAKLRRDGVAGLGVVVVAIPQSMAYALIAGVPAEYGLYALIVHTLLGVLFSAGWFYSYGPTNTQALLVASVATHVLHRVAPEAVGDERAVVYLQLVLALTLLKGVVQLAMGLAQLGGLVRYISQSVVIGFLAGAGVLIAAGQIPNLLSLPAPETASALPGLIGIIDRLAETIHATSPLSLGIGIGSLAVVLVCRAISPRLPGPLLAVLGGAVVVGLAGWTDGAVRLVSPIPEAFPSFNVPVLSWRTAEYLIGDAMALAVVGLFESDSVSRSLRAKTGTRVDPNAELVGQGFMHVISGFLQCIPGTSSLSRSVLNVQAGAATRLSGAVIGLVTVVTALFLTPWARYIPLASLAAVLFVVAYALVDWRHILRIVRTDRADAAVCLITLTATLIAPLKYAVFIGVLLNLALYLRKASQLQLVEMLPTAEGPYRERDFKAGRERPPVVLLQLEGNLFFALADELHEEDVRDVAAAFGVKAEAVMARGDYERATGERLSFYSPWPALMPMQVVAGRRAGMGTVIGLGSALGQSRAGLGSASDGRNAR